MKDATAELADISGDEGHLRRVAAAGNGQLVPVEDVRALPELIAAARQRQPQFTEYTLWDTPYSFAFIVGCLGLEWSLRKRMGLP